MKCMSCEYEINPKWKHAVETNICPCCGNSIMNNDLKDNLIKLSDLINELSSYKEHLDDWLLSNFNYIKTDSENIIKYVPKDQLRNQNKEVIPQEQNVIKVKTEHGEQEVLVKKVQSEEKTNEFFKRAEAVKPTIDGFKSPAEKTQHLKAIANKIKRAGTTSIPSDDEDIVDNDEMIDYNDGAPIASAISNYGDDEIPSVVLAMANAKTSGNSGVNPKDLLLLQQMQDRRQRSIDNFESGENRGKGGFSRSG